MPCPSERPVSSAQQSKTRQGVQLLAQSRGRLNEEQQTYPSSLEVELKLGKFNLSELSQSNRPEGVLSSELEVQYQERILWGSIFNKKTYVSKCDISSPQSGFLLGLPSILTCMANSYSSFKTQLTCLSLMFTLRLSYLPSRKEVQIRPASSVPQQHTVF